MLGLPAYTEMPDDPVSRGVDNIHAVTAAVRHIDQRWKLTNHGTQIAGRVGRVDIAPVQDGRHARQLVHHLAGGGQGEDNGTTKENRRFHGI